MCNELQYFCFCIKLAKHWTIYACILRILNFTLYQQEIQNIRVGSQLQYFTNNKSESLTTKQHKLEFPFLLSHNHTTHHLAHKTKQWSDGKVALSLTMQLRTVSFMKMMMNCKIWMDATCFAIYVNVLSRSNIEYILSVQFLD